MFTFRGLLANSVQLDKVVFCSTILDTFYEMGFVLSGRGFHTNSFLESCLQFHQVLLESNRLLVSTAVGLTSDELNYFCFGPVAFLPTSNEASANSSHPQQFLFT